MGPFAPSKEVHENYPEIGRTDARIGKVVRGRHLETWRTGEANGNNMALVGSHKELMVVAAMLVVATLLSSSLLWLLQVSGSLCCRNFAGDHPRIQKVDRQGEDECFRTSVRRRLVSQQRIQRKLVVCTARNRSL